tara:strand:+ start:39 stop:470 length:432 start_codon:yes stop_codon:yes gene_type:complete
MSTLIPSGDKHDVTWKLIDADSKSVGRVATVAATLLQGKHKPSYTPFLDLGDHVVIVNAKQVKLTGDKENKKLYRQHSGYPGGLREDRAVTVRKDQPTRIIEQAVKGMLPKNKLANSMYRKLKVYAGPEHPHTAQNPIKYEVD